MNKIILIISIALFTSCNIFKPSKPTEPEKIIIFQTTHCSKKCPVYKMVIYNDGKAIFEGKENTSNIGVHGKLITKSELDELIQLFIDSEFFSFNDEYLGISQSQPNIYTSFSYEGKHKRVRNHMGGPDKLIMIENKLKDVVNSDGWISIP